jgi:methionyl-tRNA formyltransferase
VKGMPMKKSCRVVLLAYPDNPVGRVFLEVFRKKNVPLAGVVVETKGVGRNWKRLKKKIEKDGVKTAIGRTIKVFWLKAVRRNVVSLARRHGIPVLWVDRFNSPECAEILASLDIDLLAIASAPILKPETFQTARIGCLNAHPGWLPQYRGIGANAHALRNGDLPGVTVHFIDPGIDTGSIIVRERIPVRPQDSVAAINDRAQARGAELMADVIAQICEDRLVMPKIKEPVGEQYRAMPYAEVKRINKQIRRGAFHEI